MKSLTGVGLSGKRGPSPDSGMPSRSRWPPAQRASSSRWGDRCAGRARRRRADAAPALLRCGRGCAGWRPRSLLLSALGEHALRHRLGAEWMPGGMAPLDGGMQLALGVARFPTVRRAAVRELPCRVGMQVDHAIGVSRPAQPWLDVVHRRRCHRRSQKLLDGVARRSLGAQARTRGRMACSLHAKSVTRRHKHQAGPLVLRGRDTTGRS